MDLTSSKIENTSFPLNIVLTHTHLTNTKLRIFFKGDNNSFSSDDWASVFYFLNINLIGLRSQNISEDPKKTVSFCLEHPWCGNKSNFYFVYADTPLRRLVSSPIVPPILHSSRNIMRKHKDEICFFVQIVKSVMSWIQVLPFIILTL